MSDDIENLIKELSSDDNYEVSEKKEQLPSTKINKENIVSVLNQKLAETLDEAQKVLRDFGDRIGEGDTYESTVMGFTQTLTGLNSTLNTIQKPVMEVMKQEHQIRMESIKHKNKLELEEIKSSNKAKSGSNNTFTQNNIVWQGGGGVDVLKAFEEKGISLDDLEINKNDVKIVDVD